MKNQCMLHFIHCNQNAMYYFKELGRFFKKYVYLFKLLKIHHHKPTIKGKLILNI